MRSYVLGPLYSRYSLSAGSDESVEAVFLGCGVSFTSGYILASQVSPPIVSQASAGKTLQYWYRQKKIQGSIKRQCIVSFPAITKLDPQDLTKNNTPKKDKINSENRSYEVTEL